MMWLSMRICFFFCRKVFQTEVSSVGESVVLSGLPRARRHHVMILNDDREVLLNDTIPFPGHDESSKSEMIKGNFNSKKLRPVLCNAQVSPEPRHTRRSLGQDCDVSVGKEYFLLFDVFLAWKCYCFIWKDFVGARSRISRPFFADAWTGILFFLRAFLCSTIWRTPEEVSSRSVQLSESSFSSSFSDMKKFIISGVASWEDGYAAAAWWTEQDEVTYCPIFWCTLRPPLEGKIQLQHPQAGENPREQESGLVNLQLLRKKALVTIQI